MTTDSDSHENGQPHALELHELRKTFGDVEAVADLNLALRSGEFLTLLGPSGCGKTTALRLIAGFESPDSGSILFTGKDVARWTPQRRGFGMVFQNYALFPHLNVFENVAYGLRARKRPKADIEEKVRSSLAKVDLVGYAKRAVQALSGGQQQRVALARALAIEPPLLLLDEPLSNLDAGLREQTRTELRALVKELGITAVFVTHDQEEAFDLSDRIAVLRSGRLQQLGTPEELYRNPSHPFVATFLGRANLIPAVMTTEGDGALAARLVSGSTWPLNGGHVRGLSEGVEGQLMIRPEDLVIHTNPQPGAIETRLVDSRFRGSSVTHFVDAGELGTLEILGGGDVPVPGEKVWLTARPGSVLHLYAATDGKQG